MRWADHVEYVGDKENACIILVDICVGKDDLGGDGRILTWMTKKWGGRAWIGLMWLRI